VLGLKKIAGILLCSALFVMSFPVSSVKVQAYTAHTADEAIAWAESKVGTAIDYDGAYGAQCVDLAKAYYHYLGVTPSLGNGADYRTNTLPAGWQRIRGAQPEKGDLLIYTGGTRGLGHVAIYDSDTSAYHQHLQKNSQVEHVTGSSYKAFSNIHYWGVIRPDFAKPEEEEDDSGDGTVTMYRLYNPNSGEHFYTKTRSEAKNLVRLGWNSEGVGWIAPESSGTPVYRLYNPNAGEHHYTKDSDEKNMLIAAGWRDEGIGWYSDDQRSVPVHRHYNPNALSNNHNYTTSEEEKSSLDAVGWNYEGIAWYAVSGE
jgi:hypothetical protein